MADQKTKKKNKKNVPSGVAHIKASFNNTIINISDPAGQTIVWTSGGSDLKAQENLHPMLLKSLQKRQFEELQSTV